MPLPKPSLDNRTFEQLVAEGRGLLPRLAPPWTDHNFSDPGITLLELLAWLTETDIYRLDRTPAAAYRAFLRLLGIEPRPAEIAETVAIVASDSPGSSILALPAGLQLADAGQTIVFQTTHGLNVSPARLVRVLGGLEAPESALYLGFDRALADPPAELSLHVWTRTPDVDRETRAALIAEWETARADAALSCPPGIEPDLPDWRLHHSARTVWEYHLASGAWAPLRDVVDETRGLTLTGFVRFTAPADHAPGGPEPDRFFLRCRLLSGRYECPPEIDRVLLNGVPIAHAADIASEETLGISDGRAGQSFALAQAPVVPGSTRLRVLPGGEEGEWQETLFWDLVGPHERRYLLSPEAGEIAFGDGRVGRVPPAGAALSVSYRVGGGVAGNVAAGVLTALPDSAHNHTLVPGWEAIRPSLSVAQLYPAAGGVPAEELADAEARAVAAVAAPTKTVTLPDFEIVARAIPGVPVGRARALADYYPTVPCFPAPGSVTVVVVPDCPGPRPEPGPDFLRAVARYLERRRTLTTEVHVIGPCYTPVVVHARLHVEPDTDPASLRARAQAALDDFLHPLHGGPAGDGWPVGRDVYRAEVMALLGGLPGVTAVTGLGLQTEGDPEPRCGNLPVCPDCLIASGQHQIQISGGPRIAVIERSEPYECP